VKVGKQWRTVYSIPDPWVPGCYRWRDGQRRVSPELVDPKAERRIVHAPYSPPPKPEPEFLIVKCEP
jgi:hypothetical protein